MQSTPLDQQIVVESLEDLYENSPCGYFFTLPDGQFTRVNKTFLNWTGYQREKLLNGVRLQDLLPIAGKVYHDTHYAPLLQMQGFVNELALDLLCSDGKTLPVLINTVQKKNLFGTPLLNWTTVFNATDRRAYERELLLTRRKAEQAAQTKAMLLSMISHDIRSPVAAIKLAGQLLEKTSHTPEQKKYIDILKSSSQIILDLVNDILDYNKIEAGKISLEEKPFDLSDLVNKLVQRLMPKAEEKQLTLKAIVDDRIPKDLIGDPVKITQILTNLVSNAIKFTTHGSVTLSLQHGKLHADAIAIDFAVQDTGVGIPEDRLGDIFEEYTQASSEITLKYGGKGLGLAICRRLVQLYGSDIKVESVLGKGSIFSFTLCLRKASS